MIKSQKVRGKSNLNQQLMDFKISLLVIGAFPPTPQIFCEIRNLYRNITITFKHTVWV